MKECPNCGFQSAITDANFCSMCASKLIDRVEPIRTTIYLHSNKESNWDKGEELGLDEEQCVNFSRAGYEVGLVVEVNPNTGSATLIGIEDNGDVVKLERSVEV